MTDAVTIDLERICELLSLGLVRTVSGQVIKMNRQARKYLGGNCSTLTELEKALGLDLRREAPVHLVDGPAGTALRVVKVTGGACTFILLQSMEKEERLYCLEKIIDTLPVGVMATRRDGRVILYNQQMGKFEGLSPAEVLGKHITEIYKITPENSEHLTVLRHGKAIVEAYQKYFTSEGNEINLVASTYPIRKEGEVVAAFSVGRNETKVRQMLAKTVQLQEQLREGGRNNGTSYTLADFVSRSKAAAQIVEEARKAAASQCAVLISGETGTGKEIIAQGIHNSGANHREPFVAVNCAAIPDNLLESMLFGTVKGAFTGAENTSGLIEHAREGTLFLDEINSISLTLQSKLLRVLQEKKYRKVGDTREFNVGCRIISSVGTDPWQCIENGTLRKDLYFRLAVMTIYIPPLRERREDILPLTAYFLQKYNRIYGQELKSISLQLREIFMSYHWPGNVRELAHVIESSMNMADEGQELRLEHLPVYLQNKFRRLDKQPPPKPVLDTTSHQGSLHAILLETEKQVICERLRRNRGNISQTARELGLARQNLQYRLKKLGIASLNTGNNASNIGTAK